MQKKYLWWLLILAALVVPRWASFRVPILAIDESIYAIFGNEILHGSLPYRELVDYKAPLIFYVYALAFYLGGEGNMFVVHLFHLAVVALLCFVLYRLGKNLRDAETGCFAALFYAIFSAAWSSKHSLATNAEPLMVLPLVLAAACYLARKPSFLLDLSGGIFLSLAFLTKYTSGINLALTMGFILIAEPLLRFLFKRDETGMDLPRPKILFVVTRLFAYGLGFALPILTVIAYFAHRQALHDLYFWGWNYNRSYISQGAGYITWDYFILKFLLRTLFFAAGSALIWILGGKEIVHSLCRWYAALKVRSTFPESPKILFVVTWFLVSFVPISVGGRFFFHYYVQLLPPLCLLAAFAAPTLWRTKWGKPTMIALCVLPMAIFLTESTARIFNKNTPDILVGNYLKANSTAEDRIFIWGYLPAALYYSDRRPASRFVFSQFLTGSTPMTHGMDFDPEKPKERPSAWRRVLMDFDPKDPPLRVYDTSASVVAQAWPMLMEDLKKTRPLYIVDTAPANIARYGKYPIRNYPELQALLDQNYKLETTIEQIAIYRRKNR